MLAGTLSRLIEVNSDIKLPEEKKDMNLDMSIRAASPSTGRNTGRDTDKRDHQQQGYDTT